MDGWADGQMDRQTDRQTDGQTDRVTTSLLELLIVDKNEFFHFQWFFAYHYVDGGV